VVSCHVIREKATGDSLGYAFVEFQDRKACEEAYFKMNNVLIDDRRVRVDFSQSVAKLWAQSRRGGAMPRLGDDAAPREMGALRGEQKGRIGGQVVDIRLKRTALGSATQAAAVARTLRSAVPERSYVGRAAAETGPSGPIDISNAIEAARRRAASSSAAGRDGGYGDDERPGHRDEDRPRPRT